MKRCLIGLALAFTLACGSNSSTTAPSPATVTLSGTVRDSAGSTAIANATATIADGSNAGRSAVSDATGSFSLSGLTPGGFTVRVTATSYTALSQGVTLTTSGSAAFLLVRLPAPNLLADGTQSRPSLNGDGSLSYVFDAHNLGVGCASNVSGTYLSLDNNSLVLATMSWSLPAATVLRPGQAFTATACCETLQTAQSSRFYRVTFASTTVAC